MCPGVRASFPVLPISAYLARRIRSMSHTVPTRIILGHFFLSVPIWRRIRSHHPGLFGGDPSLFGDDPGLFGGPSGPIQLHPGLFGDRPGLFGAIRAYFALLGPYLDVFGDSRLALLCLQGSKAPFPGDRVSLGSVWGLLGCVLGQFVCVFMFLEVCC